MNGSGRPVTDSPAYVGDLFFIEVPDPNRPGHNMVHKVSTCVNSHQKHIDGMIAAGNRDFSERKVKR
jgi:protein involved in ribonucleotide reduction